MSDDTNITDEVELDLAERLGATPGTSSQVLTLYIPNKDRNGVEFGTQRKWVLEAAHLLAQIGGGVTVMPPTEGGWLNPDTQAIIWESPVMVYTYIKPELFIQHIDQLRQFLHRMGRETDQGEVAVEFDGMFYRITDYNDPQGEDT